MAIFPSFAEQAALLEEGLQQFARAFLQAFGLDRVSMATVLGYYSLIFLLVQMLLATWAISWLSAQSYAPTPAFYDFLALEMQGMAFIALFAWALGLAFACAWHRPRRAASAAVVVLLAAYVASTVQGRHEKLDFLKWVMPFKYFDAADLYRHGALDGTYVAITVLVSLLLVALAYFAYERRDLVV